MKHIYNLHFIQKILIKTSQKWNLTKNHSKTPKKLNNKLKLKITNNSTKKEKKILKLYHKGKEWAYQNSNLENCKRDLLPKRKNNKNKKKKNKLKSKQQKRSKIKELKRVKTNKKHPNCLKNI